MPGALAVHDEVSMELVAARKLLTHRSRRNGRAREEQRHRRTQHRQAGDQLASAMCKRGGPPYGRRLYGTPPTAAQESGSGLSRFKALARMRRCRGRRRGPADCNARHRNAPLLPETRVCALRDRKQT